MAVRARSGRAVWIFCLVCAVGGGEVRAQALTSLEFSFSNPGARSLGFGGAFVALADDATAAFANPAGLIQIAEPELSIEGRAWEYSIPYTAGGRAAGEPTGRGIDTLSSSRRENSTADLSGLSYLSWVYPRKRWSFAVFQHQLANFEFGLRTQGVFGPGPGVSGSFRTDVQRSEVDIELLTRGLAVGYRAGDRWSFGLGLSNVDPGFFFRGWDYLPDDDSVEAYFSRASFLPERLAQIVTVEGGGSVWALSAGFLWRTGERWNLGGVFRQGIDLDLELSLEAGPADPRFPAGFRYVEGFELSYALPDTYGLGAAYRSRDGRWTGAIEWRRVEYSSFLESLPSEQRNPGDRLDDADEIHLGGEFAFFAGTKVLAARLGLWHDPDHQLRNEAEGEPFLRAIQPAGEDELHLTGGLGVALDRIQIDLGVDLSERIDTFSLSAIYSL